MATKKKLLASRGIQATKVYFVAVVATELFYFGTLGMLHQLFLFPFVILFSTRCSYSQLIFRADKEVGAIEQAHDSIVWTLAWHPLGHILCSGSNDHTSKFWTRNRPGDLMRDKYNLNTLPAGSAGVDDHEIGT